MFKRVISSLICITILISICAINASAITDDEISAPAAVLIESKTNKVLYERNAHQKRACASITKVMTLLLVMEAIDNGKLKLNDTLSASAHAASMGGSDIWLEEGEKMSVNDLIKATAVASANDAAVVLAEAISGSEQSFVAEMNKKAKSLGMNDTTFKNCNGLDEEGHLTSAFDVAIMSSALIKYEKIFDYTSIWLDYLRDGKTQIVNTNKLLKTYNGITGLKTGTTDDAGCCMSATAKRDNMSLIAVVLGCDNGTSRFGDAATLLDYGFANYKVQNLNLPKEATKAVEVKGGMVDKVDLMCAEPGSVVAEKASSADITYNCNIKQDIEAPVKIGDNLGTVTYYSGDKKIKTCIISAKTSVEKMTFSSLVSGFFNAILEL